MCHLRGVWLTLQVKTAACINGRFRFHVSIPRLMTYLRADMMVLLIGVVPRAASDDSKIESALEKESTDDDDNEDNNEDIEDDVPAGEETPAIAFLLGPRDIEDLADFEAARSSEKYSTAYSERGRIGKDPFNQWMVSKRYNVEAPHGRHALLRALSEPEAAPRFSLQQLNEDDSMVPSLSHRVELAAMVMEREALAGYGVHIAKRWQDNYGPVDFCAHGNGWTARVQNKTGNALENQFNLRHRDKLPYDMDDIDAITITVRTAETDVVHFIAARRVNEDGTVVPTLSDEQLLAPNVYLSTHLHTQLVVCNLRTAEGRMELAKCYHCAAAVPPISDTAWYAQLVDKAASMDQEKSARRAAALVAPPAACAAPAAARRPHGVPYVAPDCLPVQETKKKRGPNGAKAVFPANAAGGLTCLYCTETFAAYKACVDHCRGKHTNAYRNRNR